MQETQDLETLVIGIDGASSNVLEGRGDGAIPNIRGLVDSGVTSRLESQIPPWTPSAWPTMYTGVNPGKHGVYSFLRFDDYEWDVVNYTDVKEHTIWEMLSERGIASVVVNAPVTHPPNSFDGALVPGYISPETPDCHPPGLLEELTDELGEYRLYDDRTGDADSADEAIERYGRLVEMRGEAFRYLLDRFEPGFGFLQFQQTDTVFHEHPDDDEIIDGVFAAVDDEISATLEACDPNVVFLVSDHGLGPYDDYEFRINSFLRDRGDVETVAGAGGMPSWDTIARNRIQQGEEGNRPKPSALERSMKIAAKAGLTSQRIAAVVRRLGLEDLVVRATPVDAIRAATESVDFENSRAYIRDRIELGVRINLEGREPSGVVPEDEYESTRASLIEALSSVRTPDGDPVFESVVPREEIFHGPHIEEAPDIITIPHDFEQYLSASLRREQFGDPSEPWNHKLHGIVSVSGDVDTSADLAGAHLLDIAPTVLATFGIPASDRMDGEALPVVKSAGAEPYPSYNGRKIGTNNSEMEERLLDLGYLER